MASLPRDRLSRRPAEREPDAPASPFPHARASPQRSSNEPGGDGRRAGHVSSHARREDEGGGSLAQPRSVRCAGRPPVTGRFQGVLAGPSRGRPRASPGEIPRTTGQKVPAGNSSRARGAPRTSVRAKTARGVACGAACRSLVGNPRAHVVTAKSCDPRTSSSRGGRA